MLAETLYETFNVDKALDGFGEGATQLFFFLTIANSALRFASVSYLPSNYQVQVRGC